jgi:SAM-dependent methyltransferase
MNLEQERYNAAWATGDYKPLVGLYYVRLLYKSGFFNDCKTLLDVGCGTGAAVKYHREIGGIESYGIDFAEPAKDTWKELGIEDYCSVASAEDIPYPSNKFDMVTCTDMLEHVPEENVSKVFNEMWRVGDKDFLFIVALKPALSKMPHDGSEPHICLKDPQWWVDMAGKAGFRFKREPYVTNILVMEARKHRSLIYAH